jgi:uncharacterized cupredoxin-like copper-binding protein
MIRTVRLFASAFAFGAIAALAVSAPTIPRALAHMGHDDDDFAAGEPGDPKHPARIIQMNMFEKDGAMAFYPAEVGVKLGEQVRFIIKNTGALRHEFHLASSGENAHHKIEMEKNPEMVHDEPNAQSVEPGKETEILWKFSKAGTFEFACLIPGHYDAGMHGKVVVK